MSIRIEEEDLAAIVAEKQRLAARVDELLAANTRLLEERRAVDIDDRVSEFMRVVTPEHYDARLRSPGVPGPEAVRFRLRLVVEEVCELVEATFAPVAREYDAPVEPAPSIHFPSLRETLQTFIRYAPIRVDLPELADACADIDYVVAGLRVAFGIDGRPIARAVHAANMAKADGPIRADGKRLKPPGWTPPDIGAELGLQGWTAPPGDRCAFCGRVHVGGGAWIAMSDKAQVCSEVCRTKLCARRTDGKHYFPELGPCAECKRPRVVSK